MPEIRKGRLLSIQILKIEIHCTGCCPFSVIWGNGWFYHRTASRGNNYAPTIVPYGANVGAWGEIHLQFRD